MTGAIVWFTGLPASGKSTLAARVRELMPASQQPVLLDSDEIRVALAIDGYAAEDRDQFYRQLADLAGVLARQGHVVLVAATAPRRGHRERARGAGVPFLEVWVATPRDTCERRDPKGLYARANAGDAPWLPGFSVAFEPPIAPDVTASDGRDIEAARAIVRRIAALAAGDPS